MGIGDEETQMTEVQKELIRSMRLQGIGYRAIASSLHLKLNKVELFCKTHGLGGDGWLVRMNYPVWCENTGSPSSFAHKFSVFDRFVIGF